MNYSPRARSRVSDPEGDIATLREEVDPSFWILPAVMMIY
jgi:hypothetical protein